MLHHCWSGVSLCKGENVVQNEMPVCIVLVHRVQESSGTVAYCWCRLPNMAGRHKELPGKTIPTHTTWPFPKRTVMLCRNGKKWLLSRHSLICFEKTTNLNIIQTRCFPFCCSLNFLFWVGEGKCPESLEDCGGELMLLKWTSNKTRLQKSCRGWELPSQPRDRIKGQAGKQKVEVLATCNKPAKSIKQKYTEVSLLITFK